MTTVNESSFARTPMGADLAAGVESLSLDQEITFTLYQRLVLPLDGYVFWVRAAAFQAGALLNAMSLNTRTPNQAASIKAPALTLIAQGSLHYATDTRQDEDETYAANHVVFTSEEPVQDLNEVAPGTLWIGEFRGRRFAFSSRSSFYRQADLWHYVGFALYPDMETQIIESPAGFDGRVIVSNSLPAWLALNRYVPIYGFGNPDMPLYASYLAPDNIAPPFATVHVRPEATRALASAPRLSGRTSSQWQLCSDSVRVTLWGARNFSALDFIGAVYQYSSDVEAIGIMNMPVVRDEKRTQSELGTIAMKKVVDFDVSYLQSTMRDIAMQQILSVVPEFIVAG